MTEELSAPPPLPSFGDPNNQPSTEWYYVANGSRQGPVPASAIKELLKRKELKTDTQVWRKGMPEWKSACVKAISRSLLQRSRPRFRLSTSVMVTYGRWRSCLSLSV